MLGGRRLARRGGLTGRACADQAVQEWGTRMAPRPPSLADEARIPPEGYFYGQVRAERGRLVALGARRRAALWALVDAARSLPWRPPGSLCAPCASPAGCAVCRWSLRPAPLPRLSPHTTQARLTASQHATARHQPACLLALLLHAPLASALIAPSLAAAAAQRLGGALQPRQPAGLGRGRGPQPAALLGTPSPSRIRERRMRSCA